MSDLQTPVIYTAYGLERESAKLMEELRGQITLEKEEDLKSVNEGFIVH